MDDLLVELGLVVALVAPSLWRVEVPIEVDDSVLTRLGVFQDAIRSGQRANGARDLASRKASALLNQADVNKLVGPGVHEPLHELISDFGVCGVVHVGNYTPLFRVCKPLCTNKEGEVSPSPSHNLNILGLCQFFDQRYCAG